MWYCINYLWGAKILLLMPCMWWVWEGALISVVLINFIQLTVPCTMHITRMLLMRNSADSPQIFKLHFMGLSSFMWQSNYCCIILEFLINNTLVIICSKAVWYCRHRPSVLCLSPMGTHYITGNSMLACADNTLVNTLAMQWPGTPMKRSLSCRIEAALL